MRSSCLTMVATHTEHGDDCVERHKNICKWFRPGRVAIRDDGSFAWPEGGSLATVFDFWIFANANVESQLRALQQSLSKTHSPPIEGLVVYKLHKAHDPRNAFPAWGKDGPYEAQDYFVKVKAQGMITLQCTDLHGNNPRAGEGARVCALLKHPLPHFKTGQPRTALSIPLGDKTLGVLQMALENQTTVKVLCAHIDWYWNTARGPPGGVKSDMRFFFVAKVLFNPREMHDVRDAGDKFQIKRPKAQARAEQPLTAYQARVKDRKRAEAAVKRKQEKRTRYEKHEDWNKETNTWNTAEEQVVADKRRAKRARADKCVMQAFDKLREEFNIFTDEEYAAAERYRPPKRPTAKEQAAADAEQRFVRETIGRHVEEHLWISQHMRAAVIERAAAAGMVVGKDIMWPEVAEKSFVHSAWKSTERSEAQANALHDEQQAVTRLVRWAQFRGDYYSPDRRKDMIKRAENCGLSICGSMWPKLTLATAKAAAKEFYRLDCSARKTLPVLCDELAAMWKPQRPPAEQRVVAGPPPPACKSVARAARPRAPEPAPAAARAPEEAPAAAVRSDTARLQQARNAEADRSHARTVERLLSKSKAVVLPLFEPYPAYDELFTDA